MTTTETRPMIEIACPWCTDGQDVALPLAQTSEDFTCESCGTVVHFVDEAAEALPLAA
jgi:hypothetical protein